MRRLNRFELWRKDNFWVAAVQIQWAREAACARIVGPADVSRVSGKTRGGAVVRTVEWKCGRRRKTDGCDITKEEAEAYLAELDDFELDADRLKAVAGGSYDKTNDYANKCPLYGHR